MTTAIRATELGKMMGVTAQTIRKYVNNEQIPYHKTPNGNLYFTPGDVQQILGTSTDTNMNAQQIWWHYIRSSSGSKTIKNAQKEQLANKYGQPSRIIADNASGLNENRKGLQTLLNGAHKHAYTDLAITNKDRLTRFGYKYLERYLTENGITIHILNSTDTMPTPENELMDDFMALIASFSGRFYRLRGTANQKRLLQIAEKQLDKNTKSTESDDHE